VSETNGSNGVPKNGDTGVVVLRFSPTATTLELQEVRQILGSSPGFTGVRLMFERPSGEVLRLDAGNELRIDATAELKEKLARWLAA
jgi:hypothetical protein